MSVKNDTIDILATDSIKASITHDDVKKILSDHYGLKVMSIKVLNGYDDLNFLVNVEKSVNNENIGEVCEDGYILKIINSFDSKSIEFFNAQDCVLLFLGNRNICCPKPVKTVDGKFLKQKTFASGEHIFRVLEFVPGDILEDVECSSMLCYQCGAFIANLNETLKNFSHKGYENRNVTWMMENVPQLLEFLFAVKDTKKQQMVREIVDAFESRVITSSHQFPKGLIHGDFNEQNILVERGDGADWHVKGVLDFGDSHITCFLYDIAITMTYIIFHTKDLDSGGYVLAGYNSTKPLSSEEIQLLKVIVDLIDIPEMKVEWRRLFVYVVIRLGGFIVAGFDVRRLQWRSIFPFTMGKMNK
ncbi:hypothetical protein WA026_017877 [Henosepilachna vigintioctopunctata]|uniref:Hydroxylysine kinase n=1 Tax=Henosepilachna vigintioctopunctata TaxID=420089 RepID=A0AAW1TNR4_9CUCU